MMFILKMKLQQLKEKWDSESGQFHQSYTWWLSHFSPDSIRSAPNGRFTVSDVKRVLTLHLLLYTHHCCSCRAGTACAFVSVLQFLHHITASSAEHLPMLPGRFISYSELGGRSPPVHRFCIGEVYCNNHKADGGDKVECWRSLLFGVVVPVREFPIRVTQT